jgi:hypothetical protein
VIVEGIQHVTRLLLQKLVSYSLSLFSKLSFPLESCFVQEAILNTVFVSSSSAPSYFSSFLVILLSSGSKISLVTGRRADSALSGQLCSTSCLSSSVPFTCNPLFVDFSLPPLILFSVLDRLVDAVWSSLPSSRASQVPCIHIFSVF